VTADGGGLGGQPGNIGPGQPGTASPGTASPGTASPGTTPPPTAPTWDGVRGQPVRTVRHSEAVRGRQWTADARGPPGAVRTAGTAGTALARVCAREMPNPRPPKSAPRPSRACARVRMPNPRPPKSAPKPSRACARVRMPNPRPPKSAPKPSRARARDTSEQFDGRPDRWHFGIVRGRQGTARDQSGPPTVADGTG
jgi:hypothetical protein